MKAANRPEGSFRCRAALKSKCGKWSRVNVMSSFDIF